VSFNKIQFSSVQHVHYCIDVNEFVIASTDLLSSKLPSVVFLLGCFLVSVGLRQCGNLRGSEMWVSYEEVCIEDRKVLS